MERHSIIHNKVLRIEDDYSLVKSQIETRLNAWPEMVEFKDHRKEVIYKTEGPLVPEQNEKTPVLILLSNPHPHSVQQGMILSPNRSGRENPFWETMRDSGFFNHNNSITASLMITNTYDSPFRFFMAVLLPFPTEYPDHLFDIFGRSGYREMEIQGKEDVRNLIEKHGIRSVICFSKTPYDAVSKRSSPSNYTAELIDGGSINSQTWFSEEVNTYLTFPTGWRFVKGFREVKADSLKRIFQRIQASR